MKTRCLIVDDEQLARALIEGYVNKIPELELVKACRNPLEARQVLQEEPIDLLFLDIQMPDLLGTDLLKSLRNKPQVIFTTAYKEYALEGYELDVVDYLLKPIHFDRFLKAVNKALDRLMPATVEQKDEETISLKADHRIYRVRLNDIRYIEGLKEYVTFYTKSRKIIVLESLKKLESTLPADRFMRVHKSYIVNFREVRSLYGNQLEIDDKQIPVGQSYKETVLERFS